MEEIKLCECGCKEIVKPGNRFINYHQSRGRHLSEDHKKKIGFTSKGRKHSKKTKKEMSKTRTGKNNPMYGKKQSKETRKRMRLGHINMSNEAKKKMKNKISINLKEKYASGEILPPRGFLGKHHSGETKLKISKASKDRKHSEETKKKLSIMNTGKYLSKEHKEKIGIAQLKRIEENNYLSPRIGIIEPIFEETVLKKIVGLKYEAQKRINMIGIVDFFLFDYNIIIECDEKRHNSVKQHQKDTDRDFKATLYHNYRTIRFWEHEINEFPEECIKNLKNVLKFKNI